MLLLFVRCLLDTLRLSILAASFIAHRHAASGTSDRSRPRRLTRFTIRRVSCYCI